MTTATLDAREIRKELIETGADPFEVAALALAQARRYRQQLEDLQRSLPR